MKIKIAVLMILLIVPTISNADLGWGFKSPAFNGNGYSTHVLTTEQLQHNRKEDQKDAADAEARRIARELENTTLNKFVKNLESRIYATLSKQMVDNMFAACGDSCASSGTTEIEGSTIYWSKDATTGEITLTITNDDGTTTITIPGAGDFTF